MSNVTLTLEKRTVQKVTKRVIPFISLLFIIAFIDRVNLSYAALDMNEDLGITSETFGFIAGIFFFGYFLFEVPSNIMLHKFGASKWLARILISWGLIVVLMSWVQNETHLYILRFLLGVAEAGFFPGIVLYITYWFRAREQARAYALFYIALPVSYIIGAPVSTWIMDTIHWLGWEGWRWMFFLEGIPAILLGIVTFFYLTDKPAKAKWLTQEEKDWLETELEAERKLKSQPEKHSILQVMRNRKILLLAMVYVTINVGSYGIGFWMPQIVNDFSDQMSNTQVGLITMIPYIIAAVVMVYWGLHSDKTQERRWHTAIPPVIGAIGLSGCAMVIDPVASLLLLSVATAGIFSFFSPFWSYTNGFLTDSTAPVGIAFINSVGNIGGFIGPYAMGFTVSMTGSPQSGLIFMGCSLIVCTCLVLVLRKQHTRVETDIKMKA
ncbi:MFS transporter [Peribacillus cavernae]|uniref:MFS transporter n=1 Tax=Peribacillus cavernae TaxID=1674310 RepID=A0A3S0VIK0_9BACI|nr:MFS transporter [Peribacillus cavernae]MDQ0218070.1 ACS family tartrate transporter-like MFS transporter [Peribacillus cavernae]RUQ32770.1 MFS transporter [Peribacillus cavernae]